MTPTPPGRNDRCPCGSGKKYKHCCLHTVHDAETARRRLRTAEGHVVDGALELSAKRWGNDLLIDAWYDFWNGEPPEDITGTPEFGQMFLPWFVFSYLPPEAGDEGEADEREDDGMVAGPDAGVEWPTRPLALEWLAHQRLVDALDRRYAETACRSPLSVFVVEAVVPQQSIDIRDVLTGARFHVLETGASRTLRVAGLVVASVINRVATGRLGSVARTVVFIPQVIPLVAAGIIWGWLLALPGLVNELLKLVGLGSITRAWLGDFNWALPSVGVIGVWVLLGFCTVLLVTGMTKVDPALYESARIDGATWFSEFFNITIPLLKHEIGVCLTVTVINALSAFDIVWVSTAGGPGNATSVPGIQIYILGFSQRAVGLASALAVMLMILVLLVILPIQRLTRESPR